ncbi:MAG: peptidase M28 [Lutibacter sp.]|nr:MAG: peptidase M28 [Lutibacter sp.]
MKKISLLVIFISLFGCKEALKPENKIKEDVAFLTDDKLEGRQTGSEGEKLAADYIVERFKKLGLSPKGTEGYLQPFNFVPKAHPHAKVTYREINSDSTITGTNVLAYIDNKAENTIIIGAHYDHLGYGGEGSLYRGEEKLIHNGADDNASGVSVMLNLASKLRNTNTSNNYLFMAFSGEEIGLLGSNFFVKNATLELENVNYMINMDMVGKLKEDKSLAVYGTGTAAVWTKTIDSLNTGFKLIKKESGVGPSDHTSFYLSDIPVLHFFTGQHKDYHKPTDDAELLNYEGMYAISDYLFKIISDLDNKEKLVFKKTKNETRKGGGFKVTLGVIPDYLFDGKGLRIDGVTDDKPAHKAGIVKGDIVIKMGDIKVEGMMDYVKSLSKFEKGATTKVIVLRDGKEIEVTVTF